MFKLNKLVTFLFVFFISSVYIHASYAYEYETLSQKYKNACATLGISEQSSLQEIKQAYRNKARIVHPDAGGTKESFQKVGAAYEYLNENFDRYFQISKATYSGSNTYSGSTSSSKRGFYGIEEELFEELWKAVLRDHPYMTKNEFERQYQYMRYNHPEKYEQILNQYKASKNRSYQPSRSAYSGNTTSNSRYGSASNYNSSQSNNYSNSSYDSSIRNTYSGSSNTASGFTDSKKTYSGFHNGSISKKSIFNKIKGKYMLGAAGCYGAYKYVNADADESRQDENISIVSENNFFNRFGNFVTQHPVQLVSAIGIASGLGYIAYQKYIQNKDSVDQEKSK